MGLPIQPGSASSIKPQPLPTNRATSSSNSTDEVVNQLGRLSLVQGQDQQGLLFPFGDDRDTRSNVFSVGPVNVLEVQADRLLVEFPSEESYELLQRRIATAAAQQKLYALAAGYFEPENTSDVALLKRMSDGIEKTRSLITNEGSDPWRDPQFQNIAPIIGARLQENEERYQQAVDGMQKAFLNFDFKEVFKCHSVARDSHSVSFTPFYHPLFLARWLGPVNPDGLGEIIRAAYARSPLMTFNVLMFSLLLTFNHERALGEDYKAFLELILKQFPDDVLLFMAINAFKDKLPNAFPDSAEKEEACREEFTKHLAEGLMYVRQKDLQKAREAFSRAGHYHITDKRPALYMALIDLDGKDIPSAMKQIASLNATIDWTENEEKTFAISALFKQLQGEEDCRGKLRSKELPEISLLSKLLAFYRSSDEKLKDPADFPVLLKAYLVHPDSDLVWANLVVELVSNRFQNSFDYNHLRQLVKLDLILISAAYSRLSDLGANLEKYSDIIVATEIRQKILISSSGNEETKIQINQNSFLMPKAVYITVLEDILRERHKSFSISIIRGEDELSKLLSFLEAPDFDHEGHTFDSLFITRVFAQTDQMGSLEEKTKLIKWMIAHVSMCSEEHSDALTDLIMKWQLEQPIRSQDTKHLFHVSAKKWLDVASSTKKQSLYLAMKSWELVRNGQWKEAETVIKPFFINWKDISEKEGLEASALRILSAVRALLTHQEIGKLIPQPQSHLHGELIHCAFTLLARSGAPEPCIIPSQSSMRSLRDFFDFYIGQRWGETDEAYLERLQQHRLKEIFDIRQADRVEKDSFSDIPSGNGWVIPFLDSGRVELLSQWVEEAIDLIQFRLQHTREITAETSDQPFIDWVINTPDLANRFLASPQEVLRYFDKKFPSFPKNGRNVFIEELTEKATHLKAFNELKKQTPKPLQGEGKRFWQVVQLVTELIQRISSGDHSSVSYDILVENWQEAHFVMQLLYEWSKKHWKGSAKEFEAAFHGPEIHIWGKGPRIPHFNAGVYKNGNLENAHIFFRL